VHRALLVFALFGIAALLRFHNAWVAPPLSGFDGPYHGGYIGAIVWEGRFQPPHAFTNHPPLYYAVSAALWKLLPDALSAHSVLFALRAINVVCGLTAAGAVALSTRWLLPTRPDAPLYALAIALFLPMHIGPSALLGNQMMEVALGASAAALLLRTLQDPRPRNAALAGVVAGLGMLAKLSVGIVVAAGGLALLVRGGQQHGIHARALSLAATFGIAATVFASPYFVYDLASRGTPVDPAVDLWAELDRSHQLPPRPWTDYADPDIARWIDPGQLGNGGQQAVWPVTFASTWFDLFGTVLDVHHPRARSGARTLFVLGGLISLAAALGAANAARGTQARSIPLGAVLLGLLIALNIASYVAFTRAVPTYGALKGTYLSPALTAFVFFAAAGLDGLVQKRTWLRAPVGGVLAALVIATSTVFWQGGLAPMRVNPADLVLRDYSDPPTLRAFRYFVGRDPGTGRPPLLTEPARE